MDKFFFESNEIIDYDKLVKFNNETHIFDNIGQTPSKHYFDASGNTYDRCFSIELKSRNITLLDDGSISGCTNDGRTYTDKGIIIEAHKLADLVVEGMFGHEPLYINFLEDDTVLIFNLSKIRHKPSRKANMKISSRGYGYMELGHRHFLNINDAAIYKHGKLIKTSFEDKY